MKYTLTKRDIAVLLGFFGIVILGLTYYFIYMGYSGKTEELKVANAGLQNRVDVLQSIADQQDQLVADAKKFESKTEEIMSHYPADFRDEDGFMLAVDLQAVSPLETISSVANSDPTVLYNFEDVKAKTDEQVKGYIPDQNASTSEDQQPMEGEESETDDTLDTTGTLPGLEYKETTINCTCDYPSFKNAVTYLIDKNEKHSIKIQAVYDIATGILATTYTIKSPYVINTDKIYTEPEVPFIIQGTDNIFGTVSLHNSRPVTYSSSNQNNTEMRNMTESNTEEATE